MKTQVEQSVFVAVQIHEAIQTVIAEPDCEGVEDNVFLCMIMQESKGNCYVPVSPLSPLNQWNSAILAMTDETTMGRRPPTPMVREKEGLCSVRAAQVLRRYVCFRVRLRPCIELQVTGSPVLTFLLVGRHIDTRSCDWYGARRSTALQAEPGSAAWERVDGSTCI